MMDGAAIEDLFAPFGPVATRRMFGGRAVYADDLCFALVIGGEVWLKTDATSRAAFEDAESRAFSYKTEAGKAVITSYWAIPIAALDDEGVLRAWCGRALDAARRVAAAKLAHPSRRAARSRG